MKFKEWLFSELVSTLGDFPVTPFHRRDDIMKGGLGGCPNLPMGVRSMCQPTSSAFPTYQLRRRSIKRTHKD